MSGIWCWTFGPGEGVPEPVAPYSHAVAYGDLLHVTGQLPIDPTTGALVDGGIGAQTNAVLAHLERVLRRCGSSLDAVVSARAFLTSFDRYDEFNRAYERWFTPPLPARTCIGVTGLALGALVEVDVIAALDGSQVRDEVGTASTRRSGQPTQRWDRRPETTDLPRIRSDQAGAPPPTTSERDTN